MPLDVAAIRENGDEVSEYEQREDDSARLLTARKNMREQGHGKDAEAGNSALRHPDHQGAENGKYPLHWFESHVSVRGRRRSGKLVRRQYAPLIRPESLCLISIKIPRNRRRGCLRSTAIVARTWLSLGADLPD